MSEAESQLTIIAAAFVLTFALVVFTRWHPVAIGCALPLIAGAGVWIWLMFRVSQSSTASLGIPFMVIFAAMGSVPAAFLAGFLTGRLK